MAQGKFKDGFVNHDLTCYSDKIDCSFDLNKECWGITYANKFDEIDGGRALNYVDSPIRFMDNAWKSLRKDGILRLIIMTEPNWNDLFFKRAYGIEAIILLANNNYSALKWEIMEHKRFNNITKEYEIKFRKSF